MRQGTKKYGGEIGVAMASGGLPGHRLDDEDASKLKGSNGAMRTHAPLAEERRCTDSLPRLLRDYQYKRSKGIYLPPWKEKALNRAVGRSKNQESREFQEFAWLKLRKGINGAINRVSRQNIKDVLPGMFEFNLIRGRGVLCQALMKAQVASPSYTAVYAAVAAVINTKLPEIGELLVRRLVVRFRRSFAQRNKMEASALVRFIAHVVNQRIAHEILALEIVQLLFERPTDDSVQLAIEFIEQCGAFLSENVPRGVFAIFEKLREILQEGVVSARVQFLVEKLFDVRRGDFADFPAIISPDLDLVEVEDQITHTIQLTDELDTQEELNSFALEKQEYRANERIWREIQAEVIGMDDSDSSGETTDSSGSDSESSGSSSEDEDDADELKEMPPEPLLEEKSNVDSSADVSAPNNENLVEDVVDLSEAELTELRKQIYLTIMSSLSHEEAAHKLLKLEIKPGMEAEVANMLIECCSQEKTYIKYYGLLAERFCIINRAYQQSFIDSFSETYKTVHRLATNKMRNIATLFSHLMHRGVLPWMVLENIRISENATTSSSRIFAKILFQNLAQELGMAEMKNRFVDPDVQSIFRNVMPYDNLRDTRFSINFFTSIGLGYLTDPMREHLRKSQLLEEQQALENRKAEADEESDSESVSSSSGSSTSSRTTASSSDSDSDSSSGDSIIRRRKRRRQRLLRSRSSRSDSDSEEDSIEHSTARRIHSPKQANTCGSQIPPKLEDPPELVPPPNAQRGELPKVDEKDAERDDVTNRMNVTELPVKEISIDRDSTLQEDSKRQRKR